MRGGWKDPVLPPPKKERKPGPGYCMLCKNMYGKSPKISNTKESDKMV